MFFEDAPLDVHTIEPDNPLVAVFILTNMVLSEIVLLEGVNVRELVKSDEEVVVLI
jgi:hypothetical protein